MFEKCPNCLKRVAKGSKFCTHCGEKMPRVVKMKRKKVNKKMIDVDFTKGKKLFNRYKKYFLERLKEPMVSMKKSMNKESFQFALIQLIIFIVLNSLTVLTMYKRINIGSVSTLNRPILSILISGVILQAFFFINMIVSLYVSANYLKNVPTTIQTIVSRIGGLATPQVMLSIILYLSVLLKSSFLYSITLSLIVLISLFIISFYLMNIKNNSTIPIFYNVVFTMGLLVILQVITYNILMRFSMNSQIYPEILRMLLG